MVKVRFTLHKIYQCPKIISSTISSNVFQVTCMHLRLSKLSLKVSRIIFLSNVTFILFYFPEFPSWPYDFRFQFISFTPKRQHCILIYERYEYSAWARARFCWPSNKKDVDIRWSDWGRISSMRCTKITPQSGSYQPNGWHDNYLCVPKDTPYM